MLNLTMLNHVLDYAMLYYKILNILKGYTIHRKPAVQSNKFSIFLSLTNLNLSTLSNNNGI
jgi:hypothetical protein